MSAKRTVLADDESAAAACSARMAQVLNEALAAHGTASLAISGGSSPKLLFAKLATAKVDWTRVHVFWVDERCVPPTDSESNYKMAMEHLIEPAGIADGNVHRMKGEIDPAEAAAQYADELRAFFQLVEGKLPRFDVIHRGMGPDAHTASLFPGDPLIHDRTGLAAATFASKFNQWRVTLLPGVLLAASHSIVYAPGKDKAEALAHVFGGERDLMKYPSQLGINGENEEWFMTVG